MFNIKDDVLHCPQCQHNYLHHKHICVYERKKEDSPATEITIDGLTVQIDPSSDYNPSARRNGIAIAFGCENCDFYEYLTIAQHKGQTFIKWDWQWDRHK